MGKTKGGINCALNYVKAKNLHYISFTNAKLQAQHSILFITISHTAEIKDNMARPLLLMQQHSNA